LEGFAEREELKGAESEVFELLASSFGPIDRDKLENRVVEVEQWQQRSDSAELQFLLGYVYYQMGRADRAKEAVEAAYKKMPESAAVRILKKAVTASK
jgi:uncharacterized protein HemY